MKRIVPDELLTGEDKEYLKDKDLSKINNISRPWVNPPIDS